MSIDRGGLNYPITVTYDPTAINNFRSDIAKAKADWASFKAALAIKGGGPSLGVNASASSTLSNSNAPTDSNSSNQNKTSALTNEALLVKQLEANYKALAVAKDTVDKQVKSEALGNLAQMQLSVDQRIKLAEERLGLRLIRDRKQFEELGIQKEVAQIQQKGLTLEERRALAIDKANKALQKQKDQLAGINNNPAESTAPAPSRWQKFFQTITGGANDANRSTNTLVNTFERLFLRVVIVDTIRKVGQEFSALVAEMVNFNATIESATLGISSLLLALGHMKDATGADTNSIRGFELASTEARKQVDLLRIDALATAGSFETLTKAFQTAIAPGLQAGLNLDQIRQFTTQISQAAAAIDLPQNQLAEEIRSLLSGTINTRNTRIASALGISNDDIRRAKETGTLIQFLTDKFGAFTKAGEEARNTFSVMLSNMKDAIQQVIGAGGLEFFNKIKSVVKSVQDALFSINKEKGVLEPNPKAVYIIKQIADLLSYAVDRAVELNKNFYPQGTLATVQTLVGFARLFVDVMFGALQGIIEAFKDIGGVMLRIKDVLISVFGIDLVKSSNISGLVALFVEIRIIIFAISGIGGIIVSTFRTISGLVTLIGGKTLLWLAAIYLIAEGVRQLGSKLTGVELSFKALGNIILNNIAGAIAVVGEYTVSIFDSVWTRIKIGFEFLAQAIFTGWLRLTSAVVGFFLSAITVVANAFGTIIAGLQLADDAAKKAGAGMPAVARSVLDSAANGISKITSATNALTAANKLAEAQEKTRFDARMDQLSKENNALKVREAGLKARIEAIAASIADTNDQAIADNPAMSFADAMKKAMTALHDAMRGLPSALGEFPDDLGKIVDKAATFTQLFKDLPGLLQPILQSFKDQSKIMHDLNEEAIKTNEALRQGLEVLGLTGSVLTARQNVFSGEEKLREKIKQLLIDEREQEQVRTGIVTQRLELERKIAAMSEKDRDAVEEATVWAKEDQKRREQLAEFQAQEISISAQIDAAKKARDLDKLARLEKELVDTGKLIELSKQTIALTGERADFLLIGKTIEETKNLTEIVENRIVLGGREVIVNRQLEQIAKDKLEVERKISEQVNHKNDLLFQQQALELKNLNQLAAIKNENDRSMFNTRFALPEVGSLVGARNALTLLTAQVEQARALRQLQLDQLDVLIQRNELELISLRNSLLIEKSAEARVVLEKQINASMLAQDSAIEYRSKLMEANKLKMAEEALQIQKASDAAEHARNVIERPFRTGFFDGIRKLAQELPSLYQSTVDIIKNIITGLTDFIAQSIVDAFDPTKKMDITERFAKFLQGIAKQVIEMFLHLAFVKAALGLGFLSDGGIAGGGLPNLGLGFLGLADGGFVPGFANGGSIRPPGLDVRDTTPIWAQPGEFMQPRSAVMMYGGEVMERIRRGLIDPQSLRQLAGAGKDRSIQTQRAGASVAAVGRTQAAAASARSTPTAAHTQPVEAIVVASDAHLDRLLAGGKTAFFNFLEKNKSRVRAITGT